GSQTQHQPSRRMPLDPAHLVERALLEYQPHIEHANVELVYSADADLPLIQGDDAVLRRALHNLISNAIKYGSAGGRIVVAVTRDPRGSAVQISVSDQGPGIGPADMPHIFEPFYRGAQALASQLHGSGLGLSLVKAAVEAHRGSVSVHSVPGQGSTFTMVLPATFQPVEQDDPPIALANAR
ncbi:MAG TPA: ATP-binding protein, partial [Roseiflexaceae bacterium]|nr:ATP-binding protein [Roseiflexaceae bacterium]